jgi:hypothetical protein
MANIDRKDRTYIVEDVNQYKDGHAHIQFANEVPLEPLPCLAASKLILDLQWSRTLLYIKFLADLDRQSCRRLHQRRHGLVLPFRGSKGIPETGKMRGDSEDCARKASP